MEEIINKFIESLEKLRNEDNSEEIDSIFEKIEATSVEKVIQYLKREQLLDEEGNINQYMLKRFLVQGKENEKKLKEFKKQYNKEGTKEERFEYKNNLVMLELPIGNRPLEMHIERPLPEEFFNSEKTVLSIMGSKLLKLAFCDALLKIGCEWSTQEQEWENSEELVLASFMINRGTVKFLSDLGIGFDAKYVKLEPTNFKEPPKVNSKEMSEEEIEEIRPYIDRYAVHSDAQGNHIPTRTIGIARILKNDLTNPENLKRIMLKIEQLENDLTKRGVDINSVKKNYGMTYTLDDKIFSGLLEQNGNHLTFQEIGQDTTKSFSSNCIRQTEVFEIVEHGVKIQEEIKQGQIKGDC